MEGGIDCMDTELDSKPGAWSGERRGQVIIVPLSTQHRFHVRYKTDPCQLMLESQHFQVQALVVIEKSDSLPRMVWPLHSRPEIKRYIK